MRSIVTPPQEALPVLSQIATSRLRNSREVALAGDSKPYWSFVRFYTVLGAMESPYVSMLHELTTNQAEASAMAKTDILSRVTSIASDSSLKASSLGKRAYPEVSPSGEDGRINKSRKGEGEAPPPSPEALSSGIGQ